MRTYSRMQEDKNTVQEISREEREKFLEVVLKTKPGGFTSLSWLQTTPKTVLLP